MEREPTTQIETREHDYGKDVEIHARFMRHGEKGSAGALTERGKQQAEEVGENIESRDAIKGYSSPVERVLETVERVVESSSHDKKLKTRVRTELAYPHYSKDFLEKFRELETQGPDAAAEWYLSFGNNQPDPETAPPHEAAEALAYMLQRYFNMADKLYSGSKIDLINGTHQGLPEALLKETLVRQVDDKKVVGFDRVSEIGGALGPAEGVDFIIRSDNAGAKTIQLQFRGQTFEIDMEKLYQLAESYAEKRKTK